MDVHLPGPVTMGLRRRGVGVLTAQQDETATVPDDELLDRAHELGRVLFSQDDDLLNEAVTRQRQGRTFSGLIYAHQQNVTVRQTIDDLELLAKASDLAELQDR